MFFRLKEGLRWVLGVIVIMSIGIVVTYQARQYDGRFKEDKQLVKADAADIGRKKTRYPRNFFEDISRRAGSTDFKKAVSEPYSQSGNRETPRVSMDRRLADIELTCNLIHMEIRALRKDLSHLQQGKNNRLQPARAAIAE